MSIISSGVKAISSPCLVSPTALENFKISRDKDHKISIIEILRVISRAKSPVVTTPPA
ncbi:hypothetical protein [Rickettsia bellii]|uniref:hypothetical protein n=1 Tax=Rickettsia bellii TaxID=33990 RepID=UPI001E5B442C|nr:hypothetical protein [Rickettsia bellii]